MVSNSTTTILLLLCIALIVGGCQKQADRATTTSDSATKFPTPQIDFDPRQYICYRTDNPIIVDGMLNDTTWIAAAWTEDFVDIEGSLKPKPKLKTRAKMLWDQDYLFIAAEMEEPHVWGTLTQRDAVIYYDNDFEVFIDPDGDSHEYYELEINALNTQWDLLLIKPYRDGGPAVDSWDVQGIQSAVAVDGTINNPGDQDTGWSVEIAIPWEVLSECAHKPSPPKEGDQWRLNFSRVEWETRVVGDHYEKIIDLETNKPLPENNWVWSPQGLINMHYPEMWGFVQFSEKFVESDSVTFKWNHKEDAKWALRQLYYAQKKHYTQYGYYSANVFRLNLHLEKTEWFTWPPSIKRTPNLYEAQITILPDSATLHISQDGHIWCSHD
ncbi:carbohydrate-binding family 9-like protein [candidate division LCP-89 bacterium B3_LCP]|uniref:Carbohydrate-binding family 9-like protein n=1 Tax=candidate division LCP-89 bacterium B3_LCP TaxID=2012998 RepID=A0A532USM2_UNCL8|nr:MAG: carbohydrate-binding family 9-like protein [candidate division LCP-89 bacterium B3_LCP]